MEYTLNMVFLTELGVKSSLSVSGVKPNITQAEVDTLMDVIIAKNVFSTTTGPLAKKSLAQLAARTITKFDIV
jgi:hypothetical protein